MIEENTIKKTLNRAGELCKFAQKALDNNNEKMALECEEKATELIFEVKKQKCSEKNAQLFKKFMGHMFDFSLKSFKNKEMSKIPYRLLLRCISDTDFILEANPFSFLFCKFENNSIELISNLIKMLQQLSDTVVTISMRSKNLLENKSLEEALEAYQDVKTLYEKFNSFLLTNRKSEWIEQIPQQLRINMLLHLKEIEDLLLEQAKSYYEKKSYEKSEKICTPLIEAKMLTPSAILQNSLHINLKLHEEAICLYKSSEGAANLKSIELFQKIIYSCTKTKVLASNMIQSEKNVEKILHLKKVVKSLDNLITNSSIIFQKENPYVFYTYDNEKKVLIGNEEVTENKNINFKN